MSVTNIVYPSYKLDHLKEFQQGLNEYSIRLEKAEGIQLKEELDAFHLYLQRRIFRISLAELGTEIKNLAYSVYSAKSGKASKKDVSEVETKLVLKLESMIREEEKK